MAKCREFQYLTMAPFFVVGDVSEEQEAGLAEIREFVEGYGGTGVQQALETALFDVLDAIAVFPGAEQPQDDGTFLSIASSCPTGRRPRTSRSSCTPTSARRFCTPQTSGPDDRSGRTTNWTTGTWSR